MPKLQLGLFLCTAKGGKMSQQRNHATPLLDPPGVHNIESVGPDSSELLQTESLETMEYSAAQRPYGLRAFYHEGLQGRHLDFQC